MLTPKGSADAFTPDEADKAFALLEAEPSLMLAVSGGPDSTALLVLAAEWQARSGARPRLAAATVDHGWRPEARAEAEAVAALCARLGVPHSILTISEPPPNTGLEEAARDTRYALLVDLCRREAAALVTAHTLDDQAETVLLRLAAGSGPSGLAAMRPLTLREGTRHFRPLLGVAKTRLVRFLDERAIPYASDPTNADERLARARLRGSAEVLAREGLSAERLAVLARRMARLDQAAEAMVDAAAAQLVRGRAIDAAALFDLPEEVALRLVGRLVQAEARGAIKLAVLERLLDAMRAAFAEKTPLARTLAGVLVALDAGGNIIVKPAPPRRTPSPSRNPAAS